MPSVAARKALKHRIAFEQQPVISDGYGNKQSPAWVEVFQVAAAIEARMGGEEVMAARLGGRQPVTIAVRQSNATRMVTTDWRARDVRAGTIYNIRSIVDVDDDGRFFDMLCEQGVAT